MPERSRQYDCHVHRECFPRRARDLDLTIRRKVVFVTKLEAVHTGLQRHTAGERIERTDEAAIDVELGIANIAVHVEDRLTRRDATRRAAACTRSEPAHQQQRTGHGADSAASTTAPTIFTDTVVSAA